MFQSPDSSLLLLWAHRVRKSPIFLGFPACLFCLLFGWKMSPTDQIPSCPCQTRWISPILRPLNRFDTGGVPFRVDIHPRTQEKGANFEVFFSGLFWLLFGWEMSQPDRFLAAHVKHDGSNLYEGPWVVPETEESRLGPIFSLAHKKRSVPRYWNRCYLCALFDHKVDTPV